MSQERWDVVLKVLNGPQSALGEQVFRGPVVRMGADPGPGGVQLSGYRGVDARQCVITAYDGGTVSVAPVGTNQVRMAPHPNVSWKDIDPIGGPQYLSEGCALHLGPVGRGATIEFVRAQRLGVWTQGNLASEHGDIHAVGARGPQQQVLPGGQPVQAIDARRVGTVSAMRAPIWFLGCLFLLSMFTVTVITVAVVVRQRDIQKLGPQEEGQPRYEYVTLDQKVSKKLLDGLEGPFHDFVMAPNAAQANKPRLSDIKNKDEVFFEYVSAALNQHISAWSVFRRLEVVKDRYGMVTMQMRSAGLPEVFAAVPYQESLYDADAQSVACAKGYWQFMPEMAYRMEKKHGLSFRVRNCRFEDAPDILWSPSHLAPPKRRDRDYLSTNGCRIPKLRGCEIDDRTDLEKSTKAAVVALREAWDDPTIAASGAAAQISILAHNAGYDDKRFGFNRKSNLLPAFRAWSKKVDESEHHLFYGSNIKCKTPHEENYCGSYIPAETQHYAYRIVAQHMLAVCYYGQNYGDDRAFEPWVKYTRDGGYCTQLEIPTKQQVVARGGGK